MRQAPNRTALDTLDHVAISVRNVAESVRWYTTHFKCRVVYQDATWALLEFGNVRLAFVIPEQHPPHIAILGDPAAHGEPKSHRDGTSSVYIKDPDGTNVEILAPTAK
ncbi:MAG: VOC family protein [Acidobacteria bacterium]|nr:VOC family protein [Acidobacteriota bacterium]MBS1866515.1 VOC family protein [Acidobacteriota bacterium]